MIHSLRGKLILAQNNFLVIECAGVGYKCMSSTFTQAYFSKNLDNEVLVYTYLNVRQDAIELFGFSDYLELECFKLLISVSGVGSKAALGILSQFPAEKVSQIVSSGDSKSLTLAPGIGVKTAKRIILELKDKFSTISAESDISEFRAVVNNTNTNKDEALKALSSLGYSQSEVMPCISNLSDSLSVEEIIRLTLKSMSKGV